MDRRRWSSRWGRRLLAPGVSVVVVVAGTLTALAEARPDPVTGWVRHHAAPLTTVDPAAPLGDLTPLRRAIGHAEIVGLGESTHGAAEEETLKHRTLRLLVERMGFRSVAWEEDWTTGLLIDQYIRTGQGDLDWYLSVADKGPYVGHARQVYELVKGVSHRPGDRAHALALHHAR